MNSPSEKLAAAIAEKLVNEKLLSKAEAKKILGKLANGKLQASDWRTAIELSAPPKGRS
jgi:hypothetical protein